MDGNQQKVGIERYNPETQYDFSQFDCGVDELNSFLSERMEKEFQRRVSIPHLCVVDGEGGLPKRVIAYFTLASSSFDKTNLSNKERRQFHYASVPCILLSKIAVSNDFQGQGVGKWLLGRAIAQAYSSSRDVGVYAMFLHAREGREQFYKDAGMIQSVMDPQCFIYPLKQYEQTILGIVRDK